MRFTRVWAALFLALSIALPWPLTGIVANPAWASEVISVFNATGELVAANTTALGDGVPNVTAARTTIAKGNNEIPNDEPAEIMPVSEGSEVPTALPEASSEVATDENNASSDTRQIGDVTVSADGDAALIEGVDFGLDDFVRAQRGSNRYDENDAYVGYAFYQGSSTDYLVALAAESYVLVYVPPAAHAICDVNDEADRRDLKNYLIALDEVSLSGGVTMSGDEQWLFTSDDFYNVAGIDFRFNVELSPDKYYVTAIGEDGADVMSNATNNASRPSHVDFAKIVPPNQIAIAVAPEGLAALGEFFSNVDWSPLWVTLRTTGTAIVFIFILGLAAAYLTLRIPKRGQDVLDTIFTIPMVLPPTVIGFLLLMALGRNSPMGQWFIDIGFPLAFSWQATVIAAVVVAFPLMYRSARGAFENLDGNMLDAARTLGWSDLRIFFKLMLPLAWSSIAAGTVLSFARALGEFGATLFLAGNYAGITRTIPIAIYFEWIGGDMESALFWTIVVLIFSFIVILFINLWSRRTTKYRRKLGS